MGRRGFGGREIKGIGGAGRVGTLVLGRSISTGVNSGGGSPWLETMWGYPPHLLADM